MKNYVLCFLSFYVYSGTKYSDFNIIRYYYVLSVIESLYSTSFCQTEQILFPERCLEHAIIPCIYNYDGVV